MISGSIAQRLEQGSHKPLVEGSSPSAPIFGKPKIEQWSRRTVEQEMGRMRKTSSTLHCGPLFYCFNPHIRAFSSPMGVKHKILNNRPQRQRR
jgi:hypothetical protein